MSIPITLGYFTTGIRTVGGQWMYLVQYLVVAGTVN